MPQVGDIWESYRANEFVLIIEGRVSPSVTKVSGLSEGEVETIEQPVGGSMLVHKIAGAKVKYEPLTIERYVDGSADDSLFADWFRSVFSLNSATQGGSGLRRNGMIEKRHNGVPVISFALYGVDQVVEVHRSRSRKHGPVQADHRARTRRVGTCCLKPLHHHAANTTRRCRSATSIETGSPTARSFCAR